MSESYGGGIVVSGPAVSIDVDLSLEYLRENAVDSSAVISALKTALAAAVNSSGTSSTIMANSLSEIGASVDGVLAVLACSIGPMATRIRAAAARALTCCRIAFS